MIDATTRIVTGVDRRGHTVVRQMRCEVPLLVRILDEPGPALALAMVSGAAGPIGGDRLCLQLEVEPGAHVVVRSVAAAMAQPGPRGDHSELAFDITVGAGARLDWRPQPTVSVVGSDHRTSMRLDAAETSTVSLCEGVSLGRHGEPSGTYALHERVTVGGFAVLDHETAFAPGALMGPGGQGGHHMMSSEVIIGACLPEAATVVSAEYLRSTVHLSHVCALTVTRS